MRLYLVRHAEAAPGEPDRERPLTKTGLEQAARVGERLAEETPRPVAAVLTSPLLRARQTAELIAAPLGIEPEPDQRLAPGATAADVRAAVAGRGDAVVVGHQPDCGHIAAELTGGAEPAFPPGGMVVIEL
jgi:phosphohistidine phosphatase